MESHQDNTCHSAEPPHPGTPPIDGKLPLTSSARIPHPDINLSSDDECLGDANFSDDTDSHHRLRTNHTQRTSSSVPSHPRDHQTTTVQPPRPNRHTIASSHLPVDEWTVPPDVNTPDDVRRHLLLIQKDPTLTDAQKDYRRQCILSAPYRKRQKVGAASQLLSQHEPSSCPSSSAHQDAKPWRSISPTFVDPETGEPMLGCEHYPRKCMLLADCCQTWVVCRHCHDHPTADHGMTRFDTKRIRCMLCAREQPVGEVCVNPDCGTNFARYFCPLCILYDDTPNKDIYHCDKCQICRVGKGLGHDNFHCSRCDACVSLRFQRDHHCFNRSLDADCPVCNEYLFTSTKPVVFMRCSHTMHAHCFDEYIKDYYTCPLCHKSLTDVRNYFEDIDRALQEEEIQPDLKNVRAEILCHDCESRSVTQFRYQFLRCELCKGYNTALVHRFEEDPTDKKDDASGERGGPSSSTVDAPAPTAGEVDSANVVTQESSISGATVRQPRCDGESVDALLDNRKTPMSDGAGASSGAVDVDR